MKVYRLKHIPTGLYFRPSTSKAVKNEDGRTSYVKTNLSENGKLYSRKPSFRYLSEWIWTHTEVVQSGYFNRLEATRLEIVESEWLIEVV